MSTTAWILMGITIILVLYVFMMRFFFRESRELEKHINHKKIRIWPDEDR